MERKIKLEVKTSNENYLKIKEITKEKNISINKYLKNLFLNCKIDKLFLNPLIKKIDRLNYLGKEINKIITTINMNKKVSKYDIKNIFSLLEKIAKELKNIDLNKNFLLLLKPTINLKKKIIRCKRKSLRFTLTKEEYNLLDQRIFKTNIKTKNDFFNKILENEFILVYNRKILIKIIFEIQKIENNLKQLKKIQEIKEIDFYSFFYLTSTIKENFNKFLSTF